VAVCFYLLTVEHVAPNGAGPLDLREAVRTGQVCVHQEVLARGRVACDEATVLGLTRRVFDFAVSGRGRIGRGKGCEWYVHFNSTGVFFHAF
jgi:hypothetical protein